MTVRNARLALPAGMIAALVAVLAWGQSVQRPGGSGPSLAVSAPGMLAGPILPGRCYLGTIFFKTTDLPGKNLYGCTSTDVWTLETGTASGLSTAAQFADADTPAGAIDGNTVAYTLSHAPNPQASLILTRNGLAQQVNSDYYLSGTTVTFVVENRPQPGDSLLAWYRY